MLGSEKLSFGGREVAPGATLTLQMDRGMDDGARASAEITDYNGLCGYKIRTGGPCDCTFAFITLFTHNNISQQR